MPSAFLATPLTIDVSVRFCSTLKARAAARLTKIFLQNRKDFPLNRQSQYDAIREPNVSDFKVST
jgi:hypothetical protein